MNHVEAITIAATGDDPPPRKAGRSMAIPDRHWPVLAHVGVVCQTGPAPYQLGRL